MIATQQRFRYNHTTIHVYFFTSMKRTHQYLFSVIVISSVLFLAGCNRSSDTTQNKQSQSQSAVAPTSIDTATEADKVTTFPITKLELSDGMILKLKILDENGKTQAESQVLTYSPDLAVVTAQGDAFLEFTFDPQNAGSINEYRAAKALYEVSVDSMGNTSESKIASESM